MKKVIEALKKLFARIDWCNISVGTYVRYVLTILAALNFILDIFGVNPIPIDENEIAQIVEKVYYIIVIIMNTYKDNPTSPEAIEANKYMKELKNSQFLDLCQQYLEQMLY